MDRRLPVLVVDAVRAGVGAELRVLGDRVGDVDAEPVDAAVQPEAHRLVQRRLDLRVVPVEVGLLGQERVQVPLPGRVVPRPGPADRREVRDPVVRRLPVGAALVAVAPDVPVAPGVVAGGAGLGEPRVPVGGVVRDEVDDDPHAARVGLRDELVEVRQRPEERVDVGVVGDVVAVVGHGRDVERREPDRLDAERPLRAVVEVVEVRRSRRAGRRPRRRRRRRRSGGRSGRSRRAATRRAECRAGSRRARYP